ncbi:MAG: metallophosphatase domain-containing protein [Myxococcota bacterium]
MRLVCVADTHLFEGPGWPVPDGDVFIHAGDLLRGGSLEELVEAAAWIRSLPHRHKVVVAGNHDRCFERTRAPALAELGPDVHDLQDTELEIDGVRIWGSPWQPWFYDWAFNLPRGEELAARWAKIPDALDVLITHGPPRGYGDRTVGTREGCDDLLAAIDRAAPALHVFGHIHEDGGLWRRNGTTICNVTSWECTRPPTVLDYEPGTRAVTPVEVPPRTRD